MASRRHAEDTGRSRHLPAGRKAALAAYVAEVGEVTVTELADRFEVSSDTVRRDLDQLDADGLLVRTHGGAVAPVETRAEPIVPLRERLHTEQKEQIGALAAGLVEDSAVLMVNAGTTTLALARHLEDRRDLTIATNNLLLPGTISPSVFRDLYLFGGTVRAVTQATTGPVRFQLATDAPETDVRADIAFVAVGGVDATGGCTTSNLAEATMMAGMMARADRVVVMADSSKFGRRLFAQVARLGDVDVLVTDRRPPSDLADALAAAGVQLVTPDTPPR